MPVRVERDIVITVPAIEPGSEDSLSLELKEAGRPASVAIYIRGHGAEVSFRELREALDAAEKEFAPSLRSA